MKIQGYGLQLLTMSRFAGDIYVAVLPVFTRWG
jgi:hypothetical protein